MVSSNKPKKLGRRHFLSFLCSLSNAINFAQKVNLSVGIVAMMDKKHNSSFQVSYIFKTYRRIKKKFNSMKNIAI